MKKIYAFVLLMLLLVGSVTAVMRYSSDLNFITGGGANLSWLNVSGVSRVSHINITGNITQGQAKTFWNGTCLVTTTPTAVMNQC